MAVIGVAAAVGIGGSLIGGAVGAFLINTAISLAASAALGYLFGESPEAASFSSSLNVTSTVPDANRSIIHGLTRVAGNRVFAETSDNGQYLHLVHILASHEIDAYQNHYAGTKQLLLDGSGMDTGDYNGHLWVKEYFGTHDQVADPDLVAETTSWESTDRLQGQAYVYYKLKWNADLWGNIPNFLADIRGRKVYDPRNVAHDINDPSTWEWSDNAALCIADEYRGVPLLDGTGTLRRLYGANAPDEFINWDEIAAEANICDELVPLAEGGTQKRYTVNGISNTGTLPETVIDEMLTSCAGIRIDNGGFLSLQVGAPRVATIHLDDSDIIGTRALTDTIDFDNVFNGVKSTYRGAETQFAITDTPSYQDAALVTLDGRENWLDLTLKYIDTASRGQRLQFLALSENRRQNHGELPFNLKAFKLRAGSWFTYTLPERGWNQKTFRVLRWKPVIDDSPYFGFVLTVQEMDAAAYDWNDTQQKIVLPSQDTDLPNPLILADPTGFTITPTVYRGEQILTILEVDAPITEGANINHIFEVRKSGSIIWEPYPPVRGSRLEVSLDPGDYDFRVKATARLGGESGWVIKSKTIEGNVIPRVTGLQQTGRGTSEISTGPNFDWSWRKGSAYNAGLNNPLGANVNSIESSFLGYQVIIKATDNNATLRTTIVTDPQFIYTAQMNRADSRRILSDEPQRRVTIEVRQLGKYGESTEKSAPVSQSVSNPAPAAVTGINTTAFYKSAWINFDSTAARQDGDELGTIVRTSTTSFDPANGEGVVAYEGSALNRVPISLVPGQETFYAVAIFDMFGTGDLIWSSVLSITSQGVDQVDLSDELSGEIDQIADNVTDIVNLTTVTDTLASDLTIVQSNVDDNTASISELFLSVDGIEAKWVVKLDINGSISGIELADSSQTKSTFTVLAEIFQVIHPSINGGAAVNVFSIEGGLVKLASLIAQEVITDHLAARWATVGTLEGGRIVDDITNVRFDINLTDGYWTIVR